MPAPKSCKPYRASAVALAVALALTSATRMGTATEGKPGAEGTRGVTAGSDVVNIPYTQYQLDNGFTIILHEDHSQPLVVVNINVDVGSGNEPKKRTGFAHLFEHLMFMGTKRVPEKMFDEWMEREGAWNNAWTSNDRTDYFDVGPAHTLPLMLWMEADRLSVLGAQMDQHKLDAQREVVRNERRQQTENQPYEIANLRLPELLFPEGHPYHHPVIGSHADLEAAQVANVRAFFAEWYVPAGMSLVVAGDFDPKTVRALVERYFGAIPKGAPLPARPKSADTAKLSRVVRETLTDNVSLSKVILSWLSPAGFEPGDAELDILSEVLSEGKSSRLYKSLVYDKQIAETVSAYQSSGRLRSHFNVEVVARRGVSLDDLERAIDAEIDVVRKEPISAEELERAKNQYETGFVSRMQSLATRASMLNGYYSHHRNPGYAAQDLQRYLDVTTADVLATAKRVLDPGGRVIVRVVPKKVEDEKGGTP